MQTSNINCICSLCQLFAYEIYTNPHQKGSIVSLLVVSVIVADKSWEASNLRRKRNRVKLGRSGILNTRFLSGSACYVPPDLNIYHGTAIGSEQSTAPETNSTEVVSKADRRWWRFSKRSLNDHLSESSSYSQVSIFKYVTNDLSFCHFLRKRSTSKLCKNLKHLWLRQLVCQMAVQWLFKIR